MFVGSDAIALGPLTDRITYLEEGDCAVVTRAASRSAMPTARRCIRPVRTDRHRETRVDKAGHKHFMAKEIAEQPTVLANACRHYLARRQRHPARSGLDFAGRRPDVMVACGTAYYACLTAKYWFEQLAGLPVEVDVASEFRYREPVPAPGTVRSFVSQSGETADTLAALRYCRDKAAAIVGGQCPRKLDRARKRPGAAHPCRCRDRRRLHQGVHLPADGLPSGAPGRNASAAC
jgi:glucosamine--fructose-6-phosphate aminotransferase (isomerizing)